MRFWLQFVSPEFGIEPYALDADDFPDSAPNEEDIYEIADNDDLVLDLLHARRLSDEANDKCRKAWAAIDNELITRRAEDHE